MKNNASSVTDVKSKNTELILRTIKSVPSITKNTAAQMTGLSVATCNTILNELLQANRVLESAETPSAAGRPPKSYTFNAEYEHICCMYFSFETDQRRMHYYIMNLRGEIYTSDVLEKERIDTDEIIQLLESLLVKDPSIKKISLGIAGFEQDDTIVSSGIPELEGIALRMLLEDHFHMPVFINNDMNATALGLHTSLCPESDAPFCVVAFFRDRHPGVGAGLIINGQIVEGFSHFAGELGHWKTANSIESDNTTESEQITRIMEDYVLAYTAIINPEAIVFTGLNVDVHALEEIKNSCSKKIPMQHLPGIQYVEDISVHCILGLFLCAESEV